MKFKFLSLSLILGMISLNGFSQIYVPGGVNSGVKASNNSFVGVGTATPKNTFHVEGSIYLPANQCIWMGSGGDTGNRLRLGEASIVGYQIIDYYPALHFRTGATNSEKYTMSLLSNGNVGIGKIDPTAKLHVQGTSYFDGNMGIGGTSSTAKLYVNGNLHMVNGKLGVGTSDPKVQMQIGDLWTFYDGPNDKIIGRNTYYNGSNNVRITSGIASRIYFSGSGEIVLQTVPTGSAGSTISTWNTVAMKNDGSVGIGTTNTDGYKLKVNGKINCTELVVSAGGFISLPGNDVDEGEWPDYVFSENYNLKNLDEVASFIQENRRLPEMPSAADVAENGINLGEVNALLLKKVEELTLYILQQKEDILSLKAEVNSLKEGR